MSYEMQRVYTYHGDQPAVLADRLWPRGISKAKLAGVLWLKEITPSAVLRRWFHQNPDNRYNEFCRLYHQELQQPDIQDTLASLRQIEQTRGKLILLTAAKSINHCHLPVLIKVLMTDSQQS